MNSRFEVGEHQPTSQQEHKYSSIIDYFSQFSEEEAEKVQEKIYEDYQQAIKLRNRDPLPEDRFLYHFFYGGNYEESQLFGNEKHGFLLGSKIHGVFIPTHFAPTGLKAGYMLIQDLLRSDIPTALFLTSDLVKTIKKIPGWKSFPLTFSTKFRNETVQKQIIINNWNVLRKLLLGEIKRKSENLAYTIRGSRIVSRLTLFKKSIQEILAKSQNLNTDLDGNSLIKDLFNNNLD